MATIVLALAGQGCASFGVVRSAQVDHGLSMTTQLSVSPNPGDDVAWFYSYECASGCGRPLPGGDLGLTYGGGRDSASWTLGAGLHSIFFPYVEGYTQLVTGERPFGVGARIGVPILGTWAQHQFYMRFDFPIGAEKRLLWNPGVLIHRGTAPQPSTRGTIVGLTQGFAVQQHTRSILFTPSVTFVMARAAHTPDFGEPVSSTAIFATFGASVTFRNTRQ